MRYGYSGKRPYDYGKATWVCESPDAWFIVNASEDDEDFIYPKGEITIGNKTIKFTLSFGHGKAAAFMDENDDVILLGTCKFSSEKLIITVDKETDTLLDGQYDTITFVRNASAETTSSQSFQEVSEGSWQMPWYHNGDACFLTKSIFFKK